MAAGFRNKNTPVLPFRQDSLPRTANDEPSSHSCGQAQIPALIFADLSARTNPKPAKPVIILRKIDKFRKKELRFSITVVILRHNRNKPLTELQP
jgi:hypothetical protein